MLKSNDYFKRKNRSLCLAAGERLANDVTLRENIYPVGPALVLSMTHSTPKDLKSASPCDLLILGELRYNTTCEICGAENRLTIMRQADTSRRAVCVACFPKGGE